MEPKNLKKNEKQGVSRGKSKVSSFKSVRQVSWQKYKLKKKWRFWRFFKRYFLRKKKKKFFTKRRWLFFQRRIIWRQLVVRYGKVLKYKRFQAHVQGLGRCFYKLLVYLELRLNIFVITLGLIPRCNNITKMNLALMKKLISVNFKFKKRHYFVQAGDILQHRDFSYRKSFRKFVKRWRIFSWFRWRDLRWRIWRIGRFKRKLRKRMARQAVSRSFVEFLPRFYLVTVLRHPFWGEIMVNLRRKFLSPFFLRRVFFLF